MVEPCNCASVSYSYCKAAVSLNQSGTNELTAIDILVHPLGDGALVGLFDRLRQQVSAGGAQAAAVHGPLKRVALPAKDIVAMLTVTRGVTRRQNERLGPILGPVLFVVERRSIPDDLKQGRISTLAKELGSAIGHDVEQQDLGDRGGGSRKTQHVKRRGTCLEHNLGDLDGVCVRALPTDVPTIKGLSAGDRVGNVRLVVGRVEVLAVPAASVVGSSVSYRGPIIKRIS